MSKILEQAKIFEANSKQQASDIETSVNSAFKQHEKAILAVLQSSDRRLSAVIDGQSRKWGWLVLKGWLWALLAVGCLVALSWGVMWYQGKQIAENWDTISQQKRTLKELDTWGLSLHQDRNGRFIVLPDGMTAKTGWSMDNDKTKLVKLED